MLESKKGALTTFALTIMLLSPLAVPLKADDPRAKIDLEKAMHRAAAERFAAALAAGAKDGPPSSKALLRQRLAVPRKMAGLTCLPTCNTAQNDFFTEPDYMDAKFLAIAGTGLVTLSDPVLEVRFGIPAETGGSPTMSFTVGIFDGDANRGAPDPSLIRWDQGTPAAELDYTYTLFADPQGDGSTLIQVDFGTGLPAATTVSSLTLADNGWSDFTVPTNAAAAAPSGNFFYRLRVEAPAVGGESEINVFKVRTSGVASAELSDQPFSYIAAFNVNNFDADPTTNDAAVIFPNFPTSITPTSYDGTWSFFFDVPFGQTFLELWGGDFDRGRFDGTLQDTDDANTPNALPPFPTTADACPEGVAQNTGICGDPASTGTGQPPDDLDVAGTPFVRTPSIRFDLLYPDGQSFPNENPSGNQEWELFRGSTAAVLDPAVDDYITTSIPAGIYELRVEGVDSVNLNALRLPFRLLCVDELGDPCEMVRPFLVGDTVFADGDGDGVQDGGDTGIPGVLVNLRGPLGNLLAQTTTDAAGEYGFEVEPGSYTVEIDASNFDPGGPLENRSSTTGGEQQSDTVVDDNVLDYDFGYELVATGALGNRVWRDDDGDGVQDGGEPGIGGVTVELLDAGGAVIATDVTDAGGVYGFGNLPAGTYTVRVVASTLPAGLVQTFDLDGLASADRATVSLAAGETNDTVDFGYGACGPCQGKVTRLTLLYDGAGPATVRVDSKKGANLFPPTLLLPGDEFTFVGNDKKGTVGTDVDVFVDGAFHVRIHTSCSQPIGVGQVAGDFVILAGASRQGGLLCPL